MPSETRTGTGPFRWSDLLPLPEDYVKREIIDGWLYIDGQLADDLRPTLDPIMRGSDVTSPIRAHQDAVMAIGVALHDVARRTGGWATIAPMDVCFSELRSLQPDLLYVAPQDAHRVVRWVEDVVPVLVVEVSSPSTRSHDRIRKRRVYEQAGVAELWFVDLDSERIEVYLLDGVHYAAPVVYERGQTLRSVAASGLELTVDQALGRT